MEPDRELTEVDLSRLAREISRNLKPLDLTLEQLQITPSQWENIQDNQIFRQRLVEEAAVWSASTKQSIQDRVGVKAAAMVEELLLDAVALVQDPSLPGVARVAALQFLAKMGHLGEGTISKDDGSGKVQINILIGGQKVSFEKDSADIKVIDGHAETVP